MLLRVRTCGAGPCGGGRGGEVAAELRGAAAEVGTLSRRRLSACERWFRGKSPLEWCELVLPCTGWLVRYAPRRDLLADLIAGATVGIMAIPQSISYAFLAGLPTEFGLYSCLVPVFMYGLFGGSPHLAVGPVAIVSLLLAEGLGHMYPDVRGLADPNDPSTPAQQAAQARYNIAAIQISMLVGAMELGLGLLRMGFITNFLSHSVILGFTHGSAILIGCSQLKYVFGVKPGPSGSPIQSTLAALVDAMDQFNWRAFVMSVSWIFLLLLMKFLGKRYQRLRWMRPLGPLTVTILSISITYGAKLDSMVDVVGKFPSGLPGETFSLWAPLDGDHVGGLVTTAILCAVVGLMESISIARALAAKHKYEIHADQELRALGIANLMGGGFNAYPATGSFSRSAVSSDTGAATPLAGLITGCTVIITLLFITAPFSYMPKSALAAIIISGVQGLLDFWEAFFLFKINKMDFLVWLVSFTCTLFLGAEYGLGIAVALALLHVVYESAFPNVPALGRLPGTTIYRSLKQYPQAIQAPRMLIMRVDAPMYFANCSYIRDRVLGQVRAAEPAPRYFIMEMSPVARLDATAVHMLQDLRALLKDRGVTLLLSNPSSEVIMRLEKGGVLGEIGADNLFVRVHDAALHCLHELAEQGDEEAASPQEYLRKYTEDINGGASSPPAEGDDGASWRGVSPLGVSRDSPV